MSRLDQLNRYGIQARTRRNTNEFLVTALLTTALVLSSHIRSEVNSVVEAGDVREETEKSRLEEELSALNNSISVFKEESSKLYHGTANWTPEGISIRLQNIKYCLKILESIRSKIPYEEYVSYWYALVTLQADFEYFQRKLKERGQKDQGFRPQINYQFSVVANYGRLGPTAIQRKIGRKGSAVLRNMA